MKTTRPAPVSAAYLHGQNDGFIIISSTMLLSELSAFLKALKVDKSDIREPDNSEELPQLAETVAWQVVENVLPPSSATLCKQIGDLDHQIQEKLAFRLYQLKRLIATLKRNHPADTYLVPPNWNRRWFELLCGRVLFADVSVLDADSYQP